MYQTQAIHVAHTTNKQTNNAIILPKKPFANVYRPHCTVQAALQKLHTTVAHICSINKMGRLHRMLILKACPYQQILSSKGTETTNGTASQHHPYQQICWSTRWVNRPDCSFWPPFDISCHPETTKWVARPICILAKVYLRFWTYLTFLDDPWVSSLQR